MILDVTAGNRFIWHKNRTPPNVVFIDKEDDLHFPPDIIADNTKLPIRLGLKIDSILFDPPWGINLPPWFLNKKPFKGKTSWSAKATYFGDFKSKRELMSYIHRAQKEFQRYTNRLCFKWGERNVSLWKILPLFRDWTEINRVKLNRVFHKSSKTGDQSKNQTWWVTFKNSEFVHKGEDSE